ncbi:PKD domain-containing protein [Colwellia sp. MEBiC06753]
MKFTQCSGVKAVASAVVILQLAACGGGSDSTGGDDKAPVPPPVNQAPVVSVGNDLSVDEQQIVALSATANDSDGTIESTLWTQTSGVQVPLENSDSLNASFIAPTVTEQTVLTFSLSATDNDGATASDSLSVTILPVNALPTVTAMDDVTVYEQIEVELSALATDTDGEITSYQWGQTQGMAVTLINEHQANAEFISPDITGIENVTFMITVTDNEGGVSTDEVTVTINPNYPPVAVIGELEGSKVASQFVTSGDNVVLDGDNSFDTESNTLRYQWTQIDDTQVKLTINDNQSAQASFVANDVTAAETVTVELLVTDEHGLTDTEQVRIAIAPVITESMNDTGLTLCADYAYNGSGNHSNTENCADTIDVDTDIIPEGQDADYGRDITANDSADGRHGFSLTKLDEQGEPLPQSATAWSCVLDNVTGLIWEVKNEANAMTMRDTQYTYSWFNSSGTNDGGNAGAENGGFCSNTTDCDTEKFTAQVNQQALCGINTWRLPTHHELNSLLDFSHRLPAIDTSYFPQTQSGFYWTSTPYFSSNNAWLIDFTEGVSSSSGAGKYKARFVRLVASH